MSWLYLPLALNALVTLMVALRLVRGGDTEAVVGTPAVRAGVLVAGLLFGASFAIVLREVLA